MRILITCLLISFLAMPLLASELLHYDFSTYTPDGKMQDLSGNGHHGSLAGDFKKTTSDNNTGLTFNGKNTVITPASPNSLKISGEMSLAVTFRITPEQAASVRRSSPLVFGNNERGGRNRNYSLFFDYGMHLCLDIGSGLANSSFYIKDVNDGKVHTALFIIAPPQILLYLDGVCLERSTLLHAPDKSVGSNKILVGSWFAGTFSGDLFDLRLYDHAISLNDIMRLSGNKSASALPCETSLVLNPSDYRKCLDWELVLENIPAEARTIHLRIAGFQTVFQAQMPAKALSSGRYFNSGTADVKDLPFGTHHLIVRLLDAQGKTVFERTQEFETHPIDTPEKYCNAIGISEEVLPPWTPMALKRTQSNVQVSVWNRTYSFFNDVLACTLYSGDALSTTPSSLDLAVDGKPITLEAAPLKVLKDAKHQVILQQHAAHPDMDITATHTIDYDGFDRIYLKLQAKRALNLTSLRFNFPLNNAHTKAAFRTLNEARPLTRQQDYAFEPVLFIGDEARGLSFLAESDQFWYPKKNTKAISVIPRKGEDTLFTLQPIAESVTMAKDEVFTYEFALTATPVRPMTKNCWDHRCVNLFPYCSELESYKMPQDGTNLFDCYKKAGMKTLLTVPTEMAFSYPPIKGSEYSKKLKALVDVAHANGVRVAPYCIGFLFSDKAPEWKDRRLYCVDPRQDFSKKGDYLDKEAGVKQHAYCSCSKKYFQDLMLYRLREALLNTGIDGVYLDGTADSIPCLEPLHGCGYVDRNGIRRTTYNCFGARELIRRIYTLIYQLRGNNGYVDLHFSITYNAPAAAWATSLWSGEALHAAKHAYSSLPPDCLRFSYTGGNIGTGVDFLAYKVHQPFRANCALCFVHGIPVRPVGLKETREMTATWERREKLGLANAQFIGYWDPACPVKAQENGIYVSCYKRENKPLVLIISNLTDKKLPVTLEDTQNAGLKLPAPFELDSEAYQFIELAP